MSIIKQRNRPRIVNCVTLRSLFFELSKTLVFAYDYFSFFFFSNFLSFLAENYKRKIMVKLVYLFIYILIHFTSGND